MTSDLWVPMNYERLKANYALFTIGEILANKYFLDVCIDKNIPIIFSMKGDYQSLDHEYLEKIMLHSEIIFMNEAEYQQLNNYLSKSVDQYIDGKKILVVTLGAKGTKVLHDKKEYYIPAYPTENVKDTSGGGDAFIAGFLSYYFKNEGFFESAACGNALASFIIEEYGCLTNIPTMYELEKRISLIKEIENE